MSKYVAGELQKTIDEYRLKGIPYPEILEKIKQNYTERKKSGADNGPKTGSLIGGRSNLDQDRNAWRPNCGPAADEVTTKVVESDIDQARKLWRPKEG